MLTLTTALAAGSGRLWQGHLGPPALGHAEDSNSRLQDALWPGITLSAPGSVPGRPGIRSALGFPTGSGKEEATSRTLAMMGLGGARSPVTVGLEEQAEVDRDHREEDRGL